MEDEIMTLYLDYKNKGKLVDEYFLNQVIIIIVRCFQLEDYLKNVIVNNKNRNGSLYNPIDKIILFNFKYEHDKRMKKKLNKDDYVSYYNLRVLRTVFHEIEHIKQEKYKNGYKFDVEHKLINLNDLQNNIQFNNLKNIIRSMIFAYRYQKYYMKNHDLSPVERMADIESYNSINSFIDKLEYKDNGVNELRLHAEYDILRQIRYGYKLFSNITNSPSIDFLLDIHEKVKDRNITIDSTLQDISLPVDKRIYYGLYLTKEEYDNLSDDFYLKEFIKRF